MIAFVFLSLGPSPSHILDVFKSSPFADFEEGPQVPVEPLSLAFNVRMDDKAMKDRGVVAEAFAILENLPEELVPNLLDSSAEFTCDSIYSAASDFPTHGRKDLTTEQFGLFDRVITWLRSALNKHILVEKRRLDEMGSVSLPTVPTPNLNNIGRIDGVLSIQLQMKLTREPSLSMYCPFSLARTKTQPKTLRLLSSEADSSSYDATYIVFDSQTPVNVSMEDDNLVLHFQGSQETFPCSEVGNVIETRSSSVHFIVNRIPVVLEFRKNVPSFLGRRFAVLSPDSIIDSEELLILVTRWQRRQLTSFKFIALLNYLSGRSFIHPSVYPVFPSPDFESATDTSFPSLNGAFIRNSDAVDDPQKRLFVRPEFYFLAESSSVHKVYDRRKQLERHQNLEVWINRVFGSDEFSHNRLFTERVLPRGRFMAKELSVAQLRVNLEFGIVYAGVLRRNSFGCILKDGSVVFISIVFGENTVSSDIAGSKKLATDPREYQFFAIPADKAIVAYSKATLVCIRATGWLTLNDIFLPAPGFSDRVACRSSTNLSRFAIAQTSTSWTPFCDLPERIVCFASSRRFCVTAVACADGRLRIRSNRTGRKVATVPLDGELAVFAAITKYWGFVVVRTLRSIFVFTVNGTFVSKTELAIEIGKWTTFRSLSGFDFMAFENATGKLWWFEVMEPARLEVIDIGLTRIAQIAFDWRADMFIVLAIDGIIRFFRRTQNKLPL
jgi:hypothetical protein